MIISIINHKGGVGKTMTVHNLSAALSRMKKSVLMVDFDPQCNLTQDCGIEDDGSHTTISDYLNDDNCSYVPIILDNGTHLIPSASGLDVDSMVMTRMDEKTAPTLLANILRKLSPAYDYIIVDAAPGSGMLMINALYAADEVVIPLCDKKSTNGVSKIGDLMRANHLHPKVHYLLTRYDGRTSLNRELKDYLLEECPEQLFHTIVRETEALNQAACAGKDIFQYDQRSNGAADYRSLAIELAGKRSGKLKI